MYKTLHRFSNTDGFLANVYAIMSLKKLQNTVLTQVLGSRMEEVIEWKKLHSNQLHDLSIPDQVSLRELYLRNQIPAPVHSIMHGTCDVKNKPTS